MSAQHTPGPWLIHATNRIVVRADGAFNDVTVKNGAVIGDDLPVSICLLRNPDEQLSEDETLANGFLIAAAPELLVALKLAQKHYRLALNALGRSYRVQPGTKTAAKHRADYERHTDIADEVVSAAIAKAKGGDA